VTNWQNETFVTPALGAKYTKNGRETMGEKQRYRKEHTPHLPLWRAFACPARLARGRARHAGNSTEPFAAQIDCDYGES
jgi:hypothetical protein